ncbi:MAG: hypothetical protein R2752_00780 [Vicinamibacterales bacterium]
MTPSARMPTYASLEVAGPWRDIPNCPGRRVWRGPRDTTVRELVGDAVTIHVFEHTTAADPVHVVVFDGGGLISYRQADGRFAHTLNTPEGLARKLRELGIDVDGLIELGIDAAALTPRAT